MIGSEYGKKVPGTGYFKADIMFVGEAPGAVEEMYGRPFIGKTGKELERYCRQAGIEYNRTYRTNVVKYRPLTRAKTGNNAPTREDIRRDEGELVRELEKIRPTFVVAVGAVAARWLLGSRVFTSMEDCHAFAYPTLNWRAAGDDPRTVDVGQLVRVAHYIVVPVYHPAAGLHSPEQQPNIFYDFMTLGKYVSGKSDLLIPVDQHPDPDYYEPHGSVSLIPSMPIAIDTEGLKSRAWGLSYSQIPGSAGVVRKTNRKALESFVKQVMR